jgi:hypothetical protein
MSNCWELIEPLLDNEINIEENNNDMYSLNHTYNLLNNNNINTNIINSNYTKTDNTSSMYKALANRYVNKHMYKNIITLDEYMTKKSKPKKKSKLRIFVNASNVASNVSFNVASNVSFNISSDISD